MYKIAICDDDKRYRKTIREIVEHENSLPENEIRFYEYESGNELLKHTDILHELVFIDIRMPGLDGNQTALKLRNYNKDAVLIFYSSYFEPTVDSINFGQPFRYIMKDLHDTSLRREIEAIMTEVKRRFLNDYAVTVTSAGKIIRIHVENGALGSVDVYILDSEQRICPPEVIGEIYIGGIGVAKGYINDEEKTSNSFVKSKYGRLYRTGDFGKYSREGYVIFCGRRDSQVKIGGYRIELEEIEAQIKEVPNIKDCIAVVNYKNQIVVFYKGEELDIAEIKRAIRKKLPTYMYPHRYYRVDDFPLNTNEKIDRKMLKSMADSGIQNKMHNEKQDDLRNPSLNKVIEIWSEVLNCDVEPENDFFELGGDSIKAQRITQSFMMTEPKDQRKATNTMFLNRKQWLEILEENGFCNSEEFPGYGEYLEVLGQKLFYCTKE